jgi:uncharacterized protein (TIGR02147 family)
MRIWEFTGYRPYLIERLGGEKSRTGLRKQLAEAIPVHTTFISQVLKGRADLSLEQAEAVNTFLEHTADEGEYFLLLLLKDRAGTPLLKKRFQQKVQAMRDERLNIQNRIGAKNEVSEKDREKFYSSYLYGAIHVLTGIPQFRSVDKLSEALRLPKARVQEMVDFCLRVGVLKQERGELLPGAQHIHLGSNSELVLKHHSNWRQHTINNLQFLDRDDLHYSACVSLTQEDAFKVKEAILANLKSNVDVISKSAEEVAYVMSFDFYKLV